MSENSNPLGHELSLGQLFGRTFDLVRQNYARVLPIFIAFGIASTIVASSISYITPAPNIPANISSLGVGQLSAMFGSISRFLGYTLANYLVSWSILYFAAALGIWRMNQALTHSTNQRGPNYLSLAVTTVLSVMIIEGGIVIFVIGALLLGTMLYLVLASATLEGKSTIDAMRRSRQLVSRRWFKTFCLLAGIQIMIAVISNLVGGFAGLPFSGETSTMGAVVASNFVTALSFPLVSASMLVLYYSNLAPHGYIPKPPSLYDNMRPQPIAGFPISQNNSCPNCNTSVTSEEKFCHNCGTQLQP